MKKKKVKRKVDISLMDSQFEVFEDHFEDHSSATIKLIEPVLRTVALDYHFYMTLCLTCYEKKVEEMLNEVFDKAKDEVEERSKFVGSVLKSFTNAYENAHDIEIMDYEKLIFNLKKNK